MTNLRLQKLLYYAQGWHLGILGQPLFQERIEAWLHGPVVPVVYARYKRFTWKPLPLPSSDPVIMNDDTKEVLREVWQVYGQYSASRLEDLAHQETPWLAARRGVRPGERSNVEITQEALRGYFSGIVSGE
jgi:uncharacterized phage-associated protein